MKHFYLKNYSIKLVFLFAVFISATKLASAQNDSIRSRSPVEDYYLRVSKSLRIPTNLNWTLNGAADSIGYIMFNTTVKKFGVYTGLGAWEEYATVDEMSLRLANKVDQEVGKGLSTEDFSTSEKNKLASVAAGATVNSSDDQLRNRSTHTGVQTIVTISGLQEELNKKEPLIVTGLSSQYLRGDKTFGTLISDVILNQSTMAQSGSFNISNPVKIQGLTIGKGGGSVSTNTAIGDRALNGNTTGEFNTAFGDLALYLNSTASYNTAFGHYTLTAPTTGYANTAIGAQALQVNSSGNYNLGIGVEALNSNTTGLNNTAVGGYDAMLKNTTGSHNTALGYAAMYSNVTGNANVALGINALYENIAGFSNTVVGESSAYKNKGNGNVVVGKAAGYTNVNGSFNTFLGTFAGQTVTGGENIIIGYNSTVPVLNGSNQLSIGNTIYGNLKSGFIGIGYSTDPGSGNKLAVNGSGYFNGAVTVSAPTAGIHAANKSYVDDALSLKVDKSSLGSASFYSAGVTGTNSTIPAMDAKGDIYIRGNVLSNATGSWVRLVRLNELSAYATTSTLGKYLPLSGGTVTGSLRFEANNSTNHEIFWKESGNSKSIIIKPFSDGDYARKGIGFYTKNSRDYSTDATEKMRLTSGGNLAIGNTTGSEKLDVTGNILASGSITSNSDIRLKKNIKILPSVSEKLRKIEAVEYELKEDNSHHIGLVAQNLESQFNELVITGKDSLSIKSVNYQGFVSPLLKGWQESDDRISAQHEIIKTQEEEILRLKESFEQVKKDLFELKRLINSKK